MEQEKKSRRRRLEKTGTHDRRDKGRELICAHCYRPVVSMSHPALHPVRHRPVDYVHSYCGGLVQETTLQDQVGAEQMVLHLTRLQVGGYCPQRRLGQPAVILTHVVKIFAIDPDGPIDEEMPHGLQHNTHVTLSK